MTIPGGPPDSMNYDFRVQIRMCEDWDPRRLALLCHEIDQALVAHFGNRVHGIRVRNVREGC